MSSFGEPLEPVVWATYAAIRIFADAVVKVGSRAPDALISYLESDAATFDLQKGARLSFRSTDHQLRQPLYLVETNSERDWKP